MGKKENRKGTKNKKEGNEKEQEKKSKKEEIGKSMSRTDYRSLGLAATCWWPKNGFSAAIDVVRQRMPIEITP